MRILRVMCRVRCVQLSQYDNILPLLCHSEDTCQNLYHQDDRKYSVM
jgi:hypothetical protein